MKYTLELEQKHLQVVLDGLGELPAKYSIEAINIIQTQIQEANKTVEPLELKD